MSKPSTPRRLAGAVLRPVLRRLDARTDWRIRRAGTAQRRTIAELQRTVDRMSAELLALRAAVQAGAAAPAAGPSAAAAERPAAGAPAEPSVAGLVTASVYAAYGPEGRRDRRVRPGQLRRLASEVADVSGVSSAARETVTAYRTLLEVENRGVGRIAGGTANIVGKLAAVPLLRPPNGEILEIGCLYGLFAGALVRQVLRTGLDYHLTLVDPVATRQIQNGHEGRGEDASGTPISESLIRANLALSGVDDGRLRLCRGFSQDEAVRAAAGDRRYGLVVIDGDHAREGVLADLEWVENIVVPGAVVVLDDYGARQWPGVEEATDEYLKRGDARLRWVGQVATSAFLRAQ
ncbi:class I SAM-dependent methyltransferase [Streptomyces aidingensis]|uniref:Methyltransferase domain-containing protein n=1 Tax=Streptomyces aidingensis TaxID=910347 RepID=A0A1I1MFD7_9ACTN|nr:class I SAM-dependent methyltransferase [Streptomyces aidingensis]SFC81383.1 Methyltransferase domain-containing protein [Streptomyces aidingensis]